jgi:hypothetical protein
MQITKDTVGKNVWLVPTENNISRNGKSPLEQVKEAVVIKMARTKGEFTFVDSSYNQSFTLSSHSKSFIKQGCNAGYEVYASLEDVDNARKSQLVQKHLRDNLYSLSVDELLAIGKSLDLDLTNKGK